MSSLYRPTIPRHCRLHQTAEYDRCMRAQTLLRQSAENNQANYSPSNTKRIMQAISVLFIHSLLRQRLGPC